MTLKPGQSTRHELLRSPELYTSDKPGCLAQCSPLVGQCQWDQTDMKYIFTKLFARNNQIIKMVRNVC